MRTTIIAEIRRRGVATCDELEQSLNLKHQTASARITELLSQKQIVPTGQTRPTRSGRAARTYRLAW